ncbi:MAG: FG-GAP-like repeat-containing protein [Bacteroidales bacterium]
MDFQNMMYLNRGDGTFYRFKYGDIINDGGEPHVMNDFDNDGDLDIIIGHGNGARPYLVYVYLNNGNENHWLNNTVKRISQTDQQSEPKVRNQGQGWR